MRSVLVIALVAALASSALAQSHRLDRGAFVFGGTAGYVSLGGDLYATPTGGRRNAIAFQPEAEAFLIPRLTFGLLAAQERSSRSNGEAARTFTLGLKTAYYFGDPAGRLFPFASLGAGYSTARYEYVDGSRDSGPGIAAALSGGAAYLVTQHVALKGEAFAQMARYNADTFDGSNKLGVRLGVAYFLF